jgi:zinc transporter ZupT
LPNEPVVAVLLLSTAAALFGALGALPFGLPRPPARSVVGGAYALASGFMLGAGYLLVSRALDGTTLGVLVGAGAGVAYTHWIHVYSGLEDLEAGPAASGTAAARGVEIGYKVLLQNALHSAAEGIAIGLAMVLELRLGIFLASALAVHNVAESMALTEILRRRGMTVSEAAGLCVVAKVPQPVLALAAFALAPVVAGMLPAALGFASGCLVFLVLTELLPASYRRAAKQPVGIVVSVAAGAIVLLEHLLVRT